MNWAPRVKAQRIRRLYRSLRTGHCDEAVLLDVGWTLHARCQDFVTAVTGLRLGEVACRECRAPRCFDCDRLPRKSGAKWTCECGVSWSREKYRASVSHRQLLPCPHCRQRLRRPVFEVQHHEADPKVEPPTYQCSKCRGHMERSGALLVCTSCRHQVQWRSFKKSMKRHDEELSCGGCDHSFRWQEWRRSASKS